MELRDYLNVLRFRKWVIVASVVIVTLVAMTVSVFQPATYEGEARILISERDAGAALLGTLVSEFSSQPERGLQTQVQLMQVRPLLENTIRRLDLGVTPGELAGRITVTSVGQTNIVRIKVTDADPQVAADIANTLADEFVGWSRTYKRESIQAAADEVELRLNEAKAQVLELAARAKEQGNTEELKAELAIVTTTYATLAEKLETLKINEQLETGSARVVSPAVLPANPVAPDPVRNGVLGLAVGLVLGIGMAFLYEYLDNTIKSASEAEEIYGVPVLGSVPAEKVDSRTVRQLAIIQNPGSAVAEAYRVLRNGLDFINFEREIKTLLVTSAAPAEGKSTVSANLAVALAQAGKKVVLVNCDFRRPTTDQFFAVNNMIGLSDVLSGANSLKSALQQPHAELNLMVLTPGKMPPNPSELLGSRKMKELLDTLEEWSDWVIIDSAPLLAVADAAAVARWADGVLVVSKGGESVREAAAKSREMLEQVGARIVGVAIWGLEEGAASARGYREYSGHYYADYYNQGVPSDRRSKHVPEKGAARGAGQPSAAPTASRLPEVYIPPVSPGRRFLGAVGRILTVFLALLAVLAVLALVVYFADQAAGWGIVDEVERLLISG